MKFRSFIESVESRYGEYLKRLKMIFPNELDSFYKDAMKEIINREKQITDPPDYNDETFNNYVEELMNKMGRSYPGSFVQKTKYGRYYPSYGVGSQQPKNKNVWVKNSAEPQNHRRILLCQFSSPMLYTATPSEFDNYYQNLYSKREGYKKPHDFWEIPYWVAVVSKNLNNVDFYVIRDVSEALEFLNKSQYGLVLFSVMDVNKEKVEQIIKNYGGKVAIGGYVDLSLFEKYKNVKIYNSMQDFVLDQKKDFQQGTDYRLFKDTEVIPRLGLSSGCKHRCKFCIVSRKIEEIPHDVIEREAASISKLNSELVYIDDKTFGQSENYKMLPFIYQEIKKRNSRFKGFIIQTTASELASERRLTVDFIKQAGIVYIELGVETYNDDILKKYNKPAREAVIDKAVEKIRKAGIAFIPNIIVGFPEETEETYGKTLKFLRDNRDIISHVNLYNLAVYDTSQMDIKVKSSVDRDETVLDKTFHQDPKIHRKFHDEIIKFANSMLDKSPFAKAKIF